MDGDGQSAQDARVEKLWQTLDTCNEGQLNLDGLKKGLKKLDHRLFTRAISTLRLTTRQH